VQQRRACCCGSTHTWLLLLLCLLLLLLLLCLLCLLLPLLCLLLTPLLCCAVSLQLASCKLDEALAENAGVNAGVKLVGNPEGFLQVTLATLSVIMECGPQAAYWLIGLGAVL
jgi:hypothetical protein